jgi:hypothetical protein
LFAFSGKPVFFINGDGNHAISSVGLFAGIKSQIVGTYDKSTIKIYIDGMKTGSGAYSGAMINSSSVINIMKRAYGTYISSGIVHFASLYNRALSSDKIQYLYQNPYCMYDSQKDLFSWKQDTAASRYYYQHLLAGGR